MSWSCGGESAGVVVPPSEKAVVADAERGADVPAGEDLLEIVHRVLAEAAALEDRRSRRNRGWASVLSAGLSLPEPMRASRRIIPFSKSVFLRFSRMPLEKDELGHAEILDSLRGGTVPAGPKSV